MPLLSIETNQELDPARRQALLQQLSAQLAEALGKPERYVMVSLRHNPAMLFGGSDAPLAYLELKSIGLPAQRTSALSSLVSGLVGDALAVAPDRIYIEFADAERHLWGWNGATFAG